VVNDNVTALSGGASSGVGQLLVPTAAGVALLAIVGCIMAATMRRRSKKRNLQKLKCGNGGHAEASSALPAINNMQSMVRCSRVAYLPWPRRLPVLAALACKFVFRCPCGVSRAASLAW
jgi:hypothetical protein